MADTVLCHCQGLGHTSLEQGQWAAEACEVSSPLFLPGQKEQGQGPQRAQGSGFVCPSCAWELPTLESRVPSSQKTLEPRFR